MDKPGRRGKLVEIPEERRLLYESYYDATWQRIQSKAIILVRQHDSHRRNGSCAVDHDAHEVINQGFIRVLHDPKDCTTPEDFTFDMFRQMEGFLTEQRRRAASNPKRHVPINDIDTQSPDVVYLSTSPRDEAHEQQRLLDTARDAVLRLRPQWLNLFDLSRQNLPNSKIAELLGREPRQLDSDRHRLHAFLTRYFNSGEHP